MTTTTTLVQEPFGWHPLGRPGESGTDSAAVQFDRPSRDLRRVFAGRTAAQPQLGLPADRQRNVPAEEISLKVSAQFPRGKWLETRPVAIVITSRNDDQLCEQAMAAGATVFLLKPFDNHRLKSAVSTALKISQM